MLQDEVLNHVKQVVLCEDNNMVVCRNRNHVEVFEREGIWWRKKVLEGHSDRVTATAVRSDRRQVVTASYYDGTVRIADVHAAKWATSAVECHSMTLPVVAVGCKIVAVGDRHGEMYVWRYENRGWVGGWAFEVDRGAFGTLKRIYLDESERRVCVKHRYMSNEDGHSVEKDETFIERRGEWAKENSPHGSEVAWASSAPLEQRDWPFAFASMSPACDEVYEVPGGHSYVAFYKDVSVPDKYYFEIVEIMNRT